MTVSAMTLGSALYILSDTVLGSNRKLSSRAFGVVVETLKSIPTERIAALALDAEDKRLAAWCLAIEQAIEEIE